MLTPEEIKLLTELRRQKAIILAEIQVTLLWKLRKLRESIEGCCYALISLCFKYLKHGLKLKPGNNFYTHTTYDFTGMCVWQ